MILLRATLPYESNHLIVGCGKCYYIFDSYSVSTHIRIMIIFKGRLRHILAWSGWSLVHLGPAVLHTLYLITRSQQRGLSLCP